MQRRLVVFVFFPSAVLRLGWAKRGGVVNLAGGQIPGTRKREKEERRGAGRGRRRRWWRWENDRSKMRRKESYFELEWTVSVDS